MKYEDTVRIATPEGVEMTVAIAGVGSRLVARLIDVAFQLVLIGLMLLLALPALDRSSLAATLVAIIAIVGSFAVIWAYDTLWEAFGGGRSPGKRMAGLRVVGQSAEPESFSTAAVRNLLRPIDEYLSLWLVALISMLRTKRGQRVGDLAAGTLVVKDPKRSASQTQTLRIGAPRPMPAWIGDAESWDVSAVGENEIAAMNAFVERRGSLDAAARNRLARSIAEAVRPKVVGAPEVRGDERFIDAVLAVLARRR